METLNFNNTGKDLYHTWKEQGGGVAIVTGWAKNAKDITTETEVELSDLFYSVEEVIKIRNHAVVFANPEDNINTYFKIQIKFK